MRTKHFDIYPRLAHNNLNPRADGTPRNWLKGLQITNKKLLIIAPLRLCASQVSFQGSDHANTRVSRVRCKLNYRQFTSWFWLLDRFFQYERNWGFWTNHIIKIKIMDSLTSLGWYSRYYNITVFNVKSFNDTSSEVGIVWRKLRTLPTSHVSVYRDAVGLHSNMPLRTL